jgi:hypothetical protein
LFFFFFFFFASPSGTTADTAFELEAAVTLSVLDVAVDLDFGFDVEEEEAVAGVSFVLAGLAKISSIDDAATLGSLPGADAVVDVAADLDFDLAMVCTRCDESKSNE